MDSALRSSQVHGCIAPPSYPDGKHTAESERHHAGVPSNSSSCPGSRFRLKDGGGVWSDADWMSPRSSDFLWELRRFWMERIAEWGLVPRLLAHVTQAEPLPLLRDDEVDVLRQDVVAFLRSRGWQCTARVAEGQPFTLGIWDALLGYLQDCDADLPDILQKGVPTGILSDIPASGVWHPVDRPERPCLELLVHDEPWASATDDSDCLMRLVQADIDAGFAEWLPGGFPEAKARFGAKCAAGKLGVVKKEGSDPRLVGDSSVSNANLLCRILEKVELPSLFDVSEFLSRYQDEAWTAFSLDVAKAHKRIRIDPAERGFSIFVAVDKQGRKHWFVYNTAHFGASWAGYWWARAAGAFVRCAHVLLHDSHFLVIYVDDLLALFPRHRAPFLACLCIMLATSMGVPISWRKLQLADSLRWIGWDICLGRRPVATLPLDKRAVLLAVLQPLRSPGASINRRDLRKLVGRLCWFTAGLRWLRPWLAMWFHALAKPKLRLQCLDREQIEEVAGALDDTMLVSWPCATSDVQAGWRVLEASNRAVDCRRDLLTARLRNGRVWVKFSEASDSGTVVLSSDEARVASFFLDVVKANVPVQLATTAGISGAAAADAFAEGDQAGLGGWWIEPGEHIHPRNIRYFAISLRLRDLPAWFLKPLEKGDRNLQPLIAAFEALAQLVLLECRCLSLPRTGDVGWLAMRQECDNMGVVGASAKGMSLKEPLASVLQSAGLFCAEHGLDLRITHVAGVRNKWADALSRGYAVDAEFWDMLDERRRVRPDWRRLLELGRCPVMPRGL